MDTSATIERIKELLPDEYEWQIKHGMEITDVLLVITEYLAEKATQED